MVFPPASRTLTVSLIASLSLLATACTDITVDGVMEEDPGIHLPGSTGEPDDPDTADDPDDPGADSGSDDGTVDSTSGDDPTGDDPGDDDGDSSGEPAGDDGPPPCEVESLQLQVEQPQVVLLLDKSFSMVDNSWDHDADPVTPAVTRWNSLHSVVDTLTHDIEDGIEWGMMLFPSDTLTDNGSGTACFVDAEVNSPVGPMNADAIVGALPAADTFDLFGGTPASAGLSVVLDHLEAVADGRPQAVVLVTDGAANCLDGTTGNEVFIQYDSGLEPMVAMAAADGVPTYVIGVDILDQVGSFPADNPYERLNEIALAGGVPQGGDEAFYNTSDEETLLVALEGIADELSCTINLGQDAEFEGQLTVRVGEDEVARVDECGPDGIGWRYIEEAAPFTSIELCSMTCEQAHIASALDIDYACIPPA